MTSFQIKYLCETKFHFLLMVVFQHVGRLSCVNTTDQCAVGDFIGSWWSKCYKNGGFSNAGDFSDVHDSLMVNLGHVCLHQKPYKRILSCFYENIGHCRSSLSNPTVEGFVNIFKEVCPKLTEVEMGCVSKMYDSDEHLNCQSEVLQETLPNITDHTKNNDPDNPVCLYQSQMVEKCLKNLFGGCGCETKAVFVNAYITHGTADKCPPMEDKLEKVTCEDKDDDEKKNDEGIGTSTVRVNNDVNEMNTDEDGISDGKFGAYSVAYVSDIYDGGKGQYGGYGNLGDSGGDGDDNYGGNKDGYGGYGYYGGNKDGYGSYGNDGSKKNKKGGYSDYSGNNGGYGGYGNYGGNEDKRGGRGDYGGNEDKRGGRGDYGGDYGGYGGYGDYGGNEDNRGGRGGNYGGYGGYGNQRGYENYDGYESSASFIYSCRFEVLVSQLLGFVIAATIKLLVAG